MPVIDEGLTFLPLPATVQPAIAPTDVYRIRSISPDVWSFKWVRLGLLDWLKALGSEANAMYKQTVTTWSVKPTFAILKRSFNRKGFMSVVAGGNVNTGRGKAKKMHPARLHGLLDRGALLHLVEARNAPYLVFGEDFEPKTIPHSFTATGGIRGGRVRKVLAVPSFTRPRGWTEDIQEILQGKMAKEAVDVIEAGLAKGNAGSK